MGDEHSWGITTVTNYITLCLYMSITVFLSHCRGGSRIYKREGGGANSRYYLLGRGMRSTLPSMQSILELGGSGGMPPQENFEK